MGIIVKDKCINCGAHETECSNTAIYEGENLEIETIEQGLVVAVICDRGDRYYSSTLFDVF